MQLWQLKIIIDEVLNVKTKNKIEKDINDQAELLNSW